MSTIIQKFHSDARHFQILYLGSFLILSFIVMGREDYFKCLGVVTTALMVQLMGIKFTDRTFNLSDCKSALITSLGLCLLLKTNHWETSILAVIIAIGSKFIIRYKEKHIFNPVNIGIIATIFITQDAWISPGQWGSNTLFIFVLGALGFMVLSKAERLDISLAFLGSYAFLLFSKNILYLGWPFDFFIQQISNGTLMLFSFFMITDPMTTPNHRKGRILFGIAIAVLSFLLSSEFYFYTAPIYVLFFMCAFTPLFDHIWKAKKYQWKIDIPYPNPSPKGRGLL